MAPPPPSSRDRDRHHHHRTISSTTLLLVLSLILAVLAVMLSMPGSSHAVSAELGAQGGWLNYLTPRRTHAIVAREHAVAIREAEVAKREAELLVGNIAGLPACIPGPGATQITVVTTETLSAPAETQTIIKEIVETIGAPPPPAWLKDPQSRLDEVLQREHKVSEREKDVGLREEAVGKRENDASRRENWIMEQLIALNNEPVEVETEYVLPPSKSPAKLDETPFTSIATYTKTVVQTVSAAAHTRRAPTPTPEEYSSSPPPERPAKTVEAIEEPAERATETVTVVQRERVRPSVYPGPDRRWWW